MSDHKKLIVLSLIFLMIWTLAILGALTIWIDENS